jgi:hypothetical protein
VSWQVEVAKVEIISGWEIWDTLKKISPGMVEEVPEIGGQAC